MIRCEVFCLIVCTVFLTDFVNDLSRALLLIKHKNFGPLCKRYKFLFVQNRMNKLLLSTVVIDVDISFSMLKITMGNSFACTTNFL